MTSFAFVFPGQGSQAVGMLNGWSGHPAVIETLQEASDALDQDIAKLIAEGPKEALALTTNTQPVMLVAGVAAWRAWRAEGGGEPSVLAGHSLGEYSALVASGVLTLAQAAPLVRFRAQAMQQAVPVGVGAMAAILGMDADKVREGCAEAAATFGGASGEVVEAVNFNDPLQTVIAGSKSAVDKACELLKSKGAKRALPLPVSAPFHSSLMKPAAEALAGRLADIEFRAPQIPVINNIDVLVETEADRIRDALVRQAFGPVRWVETIRAVEARSATTVVECGPGRVLAGTAKRTAPGLAVMSIFDTATLAETKQSLGD
ncbi:MAG: ACP S-malonyltransferase [Gammaproteobacteria bacterium]|nr:ACP S-malonyltransferase [Gammaproteobacteria bacterium]MBU1442050.1 ACP S-malonyltransferase [Gammaproteobacteria bacterium]